MGLNPMPSSILEECSELVTTRPRKTVWETISAFKSPLFRHFWRGAGIGKQASLETKRVNSPRTVGTCPLRQGVLVKRHHTSLSMK